MSAGIVSSAGGVSASQSFIYDALNRLYTSGETSAWTRNYSYGAFSNGWVSSATGIALSANTATAQSNFDVNNRLNVNLSSYESAGNQKSIGGSAVFANTFDAENRMVTANLSGTSSTAYVYDGDGRRVQKVTCPLGTSPCTPSSTGAVASETYVYDGARTLTAEYGTVPTAPCTTCYLTVDALGSARMMTDAGGSIRSLHDYLPFGEEIGAGVGGRSSTLYMDRAVTTGDGTAQKFTGKLRDNETGLDFFGARYFSGAQGRFTSPDWSATPQAVPYASLGDPQTLNLYAYMRNNPLASEDADGHQMPVDPSMAAMVQFYHQTHDTPEQAKLRANIDERTGTAALGAAALISAVPTGGGTLEAMAAGNVVAYITGTLMTGGLDW
jgi:RHS repeat-associated protein